jgi:hypothetical protein
MSGCNCIGAEAWWRTAEAGLADGHQSGSEVQSPMCCTPGVLNCTNRRVQKQRVSCVEERLTAKVIQLASGEQQHGAKCLDAIVLSRSMVAYRRGRPCRTVRWVRNAVTRCVARQGFLNCTPDHDQNSPEA